MLHICEKAEQACMAPVGIFPKGCPHAVPHEMDAECILGTCCERFCTESRLVNMVPVAFGRIYVRHVPA
jgi:hypothetical protein